MSLHIFGIRHHGPGSARSLERALLQLAPDCLLIEGPPEADAILALAKHIDMTAPVALLIYASDHPVRSVFYPFARFSPEWVALRYALERDLPVHFMDLPQAHQLLEPEPEMAKPETPDPKMLEAEKIEPYAWDDDEAGNTDVNNALTDDPAIDPLSFLARVAGFEDGERYWEFLVESRGTSNEISDNIFSGITEIMAALRKESTLKHGQHALATAKHILRESQREAFMRQTIRQAIKAGYQKIAVVCGAWHAPALDIEEQKVEGDVAGKDIAEKYPVPSAKADAATLKGLPKVKVSATWVPWSHGLLARSSGYGAGIESPGWYAHLFDHMHLDSQQITIAWMVRVARLLRGKDMNASSASVIEVVRLAEAIAALRGLPLPGLLEVNEAARALFCWDSNTPMDLIHHKLVTGEVIGNVPIEVPRVPLQADFEKTVKSLRLKLDAEVKILELDLREGFDLAKSHFLHRLALLGVSWGSLSHSRSTGTFRETWELKWEPAFAIGLIEGSRFGPTVLEATQACVIDRARNLAELPQLSSLLDATMLAELPIAVDAILQKLEALSTTTNDIAHLCTALPSLVHVARYGNVRQTDASVVRHVISTLVTRIVIGLPNACRSLNEDAAQAMYEHILATHNAIQILEDAHHREAWLSLLEQLLGQDGLHGLIAGRAARLLLETDRLNHESAARELKLAVSQTNAPEAVAAWIDGFLRNSGIILVHDNVLFTILDQWIATLSGEEFQATLPLLRRTFSTFEAAERRNIGQKARAGVHPNPSVTTSREKIHQARGAMVLPLLRQILGLEPQ